MNVGSINVTVLFFGAARDAAGVGEAQLAFSLGANVETVRDTVFSDFQGMRALSKGVMIAVNEEYARAETAVVDGDIVAFLPPVSGG